ncbi:MAG: class I tRNA ligase family protein, partial [Candidatus Liptonbacteria bacterium]|nr:class I tRNA ligase family protein [Candidatus Liptonbacteria bacterium]
MLEKSYDHQAVEKKIYELWEKSGFFNPDNLPTTNYKLQTSKLKPSAFTVIMPPPNANGALHIGHAVGMTLQDIMIRYHRMKGDKTLWLPGADHAGFETQVVYDKKLEKEGRNRNEIPRDKLWQEIFDFTQKNKEMMYAQTKKLGASCDWSRETFTLDPKIIKIVYETFEKMYKDELVYRDLRIINWCPKHQTALSDLEVKYVERLDPLYYIKYGPLTLATVRPETKFGDTALAVNPKDPRYKKYVGKIIHAQGVQGNLTFKVIADEAIDPKFGTGVVKVTPAHDATDFEIWTRHKSEIPGPKIIINERGRLTGEVGEFTGMKIMEAREKIVERMKEIGILEKIDLNYKHQIATCFKCGGTL